MALGDANSKFSHQYASAHQNFNTVWDLEDHLGNPITNEDALLAEGKRHFARVFNDDTLALLQEKLEVLILYPRYFSAEEADSIGRPVSLDEIEAVLKGFAKDKSLGPDGFEIFLVVYDLVGEDILKAVEYSRVHGYLPPVEYNLTFF